MSESIIDRNIPLDSKDAEYFEMIIKLKEQIYSNKIEIKELNLVISDRDELISHFRNDNK